MKKHDKLLLTKKERIVFYEKSYFDIRINFEF